MIALKPQDEPPAEETPGEYLARPGQAGEGPHDLALGALMLAALDHPERKLSLFRAHLYELGQAVKTEAEFARDIDRAARALGTVVAARYGYDGERVHYDDPANADLIAVIERRRGLPVTLGILYIHAARAAGMEACGLFAPGHFILRVAKRGGEALIDPFNGGAVVEKERVTAPGLGTPPLLAEPGSPDDPSPFDPVSDTDVLLRLENNLRSRAIQRNDTARAIEICRRMALIAPKRAALWLELARLQEGAGSLSVARMSYENCLKASLTGEVLHNEATLALSSLKRRLN